MKNKHQILFDKDSKKCVLLCVGTIPERPEKMFADLNDDDMLYLAFTLITEGENANRDEVSKEFLLRRFKSARLKPVTMAVKDGRPSGHWKLDASGNVEFDETGSPEVNNHAIGAMVHSAVIEGVESDPMRIDAVAGIWKKYFSEEAEIIRREFSQGQLYFSIEIDIDDCTLKANGGRFVKDGVITAVAIVDNPAYGAATRAHDMRANKTKMAASTQTTKERSKQMPDEIKIKLIDAPEVLAGLNAAKEEARKELQASIDKSAQEVEAMKSAKAETDAKLEAAGKEIEALKASISEKDEAIAAKDKEIEEKTAEIDKAKGEALTAGRKAELEKIPGEELKAEVIEGLGSMSEDAFSLLKAQRENAGLKATLKAAKDNGTLIAGADLPMFPDNNGTDDGPAKPEDFQTL